MALSRAGSQLCAAAYKRTRQKPAWPCSHGHQGSTGQRHRAPQCWPRRRQKESQVSAILLMSQNTKNWYVQWPMLTHLPALRATELKRVRAGEWRLDISGLSTGQCSQVLGASPPTPRTRAHLRAGTSALRSVSSASQYGDGFRAFSRPTHTSGRWSITRTSPTLKPTLEGAHSVVTRSLMRFVLHEPVPRSCTNMPTVGVRAQEVRLLPPGQGWWGLVQHPRGSGAAGSPLQTFCHNCGKCGRRHPALVEGWAWHPASTENALTPWTRGWEAPRHTNRYQLRRVSYGRFWTRA